MKKLIIIDGNAIMHRGFHALPPLTDKNGELVNAVYGFFSMLLKVIEDYGPTHVIVCFDRPKPTFRKLLYAGYQSQRPPMVDGLSSQFVLVHEALKDSHFTIMEVDGYEADDLIGTLAHQSADHNQIETLIVTGDRDLLQLVNPHVKVLSPILGITKMTLFDEEKVKEKMGVTPKQIIDYKALVGDQSDGYPGVTGIGPKTAMTLLEKYQTHEKIYTHLSDMKESLALKLATDAEQSALAYKLATIVTDAPVHLKLDECSLSHISKEDLYTVFEKFNFSSLSKRLETMKVIQNKPKDSEQLELL